MGGLHCTCDVSGAWVGLAGTEWDLVGGATGDVTCAWCERVMSGVRERLSRRCGKSGLLDAFAYHPLLLTLLLLLCDADVTLAPEVKAVDRNLLLNALSCFDPAAGLREVSKLVAGCERLSGVIRLEATRGPIRFTLQVTLLGVKLVDDEAKSEFGEDFRTTPALHGDALVAGVCAADDS